jgi:hypothetical protein
MVVAAYVVLQTLVLFTLGTTAARFQLGRYFRDFRKVKGKRLKPQLC